MADMNMDILRIRSQKPVFPAHPVRSGNVSTAVESPAFANLFDEAKNRVAFSEHAKARMEARHIDFSEEDLTKLDATVGKMAEKGAKEALILLNDVALVVSIKNRTVITAMDGKNAKDNIFTNIDSAAIV
ncbi:TIGR02530 family flagellar biosynthesis protein [Selenomonas sp. TAMA-11512]|uniref:TIGR02530 family flagellar biosynthesis protein n=1 Tax=Selenomonas sp. TAMA-11512 TaxID=3095337 RepID=UPI00308F55B5|nr:TIGR02530 family flagellar biosynthesis protein [Selenomonas sp. TAMA-11512]